MGFLPRGTPYVTAVCSALLASAAACLAKEAAPRSPAPSAPTPAPTARANVRNHPSEALKAWMAQLPPAPEGVSDLRFDEFFKRPVGPLGLELNPRMRELDGKRVRILGYMVKQSRPTPWTMMLSPMPGISNEAEFGLAEDLPPNVVRVLLPKGPQPITPHTPGLLLLTGRLEVGGREEVDGRTSLVRLHVDREPVPAPSPVVQAQTNAAPAALPLSTPGEPRR